MSFDWNQSAEHQERTAEPMPDGVHVAAITRVIGEDREGRPRISNDGDPQIIAIFSDNQSREAPVFCSCVNDPRKAGNIAAIISGSTPAFDYARMNEAGITPAHFADAPFAENNLLGRCCRIHVKHIENRKTPQVTIDVKKPPSDAEASALVDPQPATPQAPTSPPASSQPPTPAPPYQAPPQQSAPPPQAPTPPPATQGPPPTEPPAAATPAPGTKADAWAAVQAAWTSRGGDARENENHRNQAWIKAVQDRGKPEGQFMPHDWAAVAEAASLPF